MGLTASGLKRGLAQAYDEQAAGFAAHADEHVFGHVCRPLARAIDAAIAPGSGPVLDVATGTGALGRQLGDAVGADLSFEQLRHNCLAIRVQADAERLPFGRDAFGAVGCAFGVNHLPDPVRGLVEMARVAPVVGVATWLRPDAAYRPKQVVTDLVNAHARGPSAVGATVEAMTEAIGSAAAVARVLEAAGLDAEVWVERPTVPWPGAEEFVAYRLAMPGLAGMDIDRAAVRRDALGALAALAPGELIWQPGVVLGLGRRRRP